jgi:sulfur transfer protein SufE
MKTSVNGKLESWLTRGYGITQLQALEKWGCMRLSARINELRTNGMNILTTMIQRDGKTYAKYSLLKP